MQSPPPSQRPPTHAFSQKMDSMESSTITAPISPPSSEASNLSEEEVHSEIYADDSYGPVVFKVSFTSILFN